jgi:hypothetical protein
MIKEIVEEEILRGVPMLNSIFVRVEGNINFEELGKIYLCWFFNVLGPGRYGPIAS